MTNPVNITAQDVASTTTTGQGGQTIISGTPTPNSSVVATLLGGGQPIANSFSLNVSGTWTGTLQIESSVDGGVTFVPYDAAIIGTSNTASTMTSNGSFKGNGGGLTNLRIRATAAMTGTAVINLQTYAAQDVQHIQLDATGITVDVGKVAIDQTTPGTTNGVQVNNGNNGTFQVGQVVIATTGTAVRLTATSYVLQNGIVLSSSTNNNAAQGTVGTSAVTNVTNGTGNGFILAPGAATGIPAGANINTIYVNGTSGDVFSWEGN